MFVQKELARPRIRWEESIKVRLKGTRQKYAHTSLTYV
jgi:hypothetical protein